MKLYTAYTAAAEYYVHFEPFKVAYFLYFDTELHRLAICSSLVDLAAVSSG